MSNVYLKVAVEKNWRSQNADFSKIENSSPRQFLTRTDSHISLSFKTSCWNFKISGLGPKHVWLFYWFEITKECSPLRVFVNKITTVSTSFWKTPLSSCLCTLRCIQRLLAIKYLKTTKFWIHLSSTNTEVFRALLGI